MLYLIASIPDLCPLSYFVDRMPDYPVFPPSYPYESAHEGKKGAYMYIVWYSLDVRAKLFNVAGSPLLDLNFQLHVLRNVTCDRYELQLVLVRICCYTGLS